ncbi:MAG: TolC family protein, partial [Bacteroidota bacterium]|nr:TolC family protein [Bacteroidota bacterium]
MMIKCYKSVGVALLLLSAINLKGQKNQLTLDSCYILARQNYPLIKRQGLISKSSNYSLENAGKSYLPQFSVNGQASYQSQTIDFHDVLPGAPPGALPTISKDQYKIQAEVNQQIYDAGATKNQKEFIRANEAIQQESLEVALHTLRDRVNQIYFSILLMNEQLSQNEIRKTDLQNTLDKARTALRNGTGFRSNVDELKAELINVDMSGIEFNATRKAYLNMLSLLIGRFVDETTPLVQPESPPLVTEINRPELRLYELQIKATDIREKQLKSDYLPKLSAFVQGAYGRPTLNFIENQFGAWWIGGLRLNWSLGSLYSLRNNRN